jgi:hypothetical protein
VQAQKGEHINTSANRKLLVPAHTLNALVTPVQFCSPSACSTLTYIIFQPSFLPVPFPTAGACTGLCRLSC